MTVILLSVLPAFSVPVEMTLPLDLRVLAFSAALTLVAAVLCGLAPALHMSKADVISGLKDESQGPTDRLQLRNAFVVAQIAFSVLLVVAAGLFAQALQRLSAIDQGFDAHGVESTTLDLSAAGYDEATGALFSRNLAERVRQLPGAEAATLSQYLPPLDAQDGPAYVRWARAVHRSP